LFRFFVPPLPASVLFPFPFLSLASLPSFNKNRAISFVYALCPDSCFFTPPRFSGNFLDFFAAPISSPPLDNCFVFLLPFACPHRGAFFFFQLTNPPLRFFTQRGAARNVGRAVPLLANRSRGQRSTTHPPVFPLPRPPAPSRCGAMAFLRAAFHSPPCLARGALRSCRVFRLSRCRVFPHFCRRFLLGQYFSYFWIIFDAVAFAILRAFLAVVSTCSLLGWDRAELFLAVYF